MRSKKIVFRLATATATASVLTIIVLYAIPWPALAQTEGVGALAQGVDAIIEAGGTDLVRWLAIALGISLAIIYLLVRGLVKVLVSMIAKPDFFVTPAALAMLEKSIWNIGSRVIKAAKENTLEHRKE